MKPLISIEVIKNILKKDKTADLFNEISTEQQEVIDNVDIEISRDQISNSESFIAPQR